MRDTTFSENKASTGGAIYMQDGSSMQAINCKFFKNECHDVHNGHGGAFYLKVN